MSNKWIRRLDEITKSFKTEFGDLTIEALNWKPNNHVWSIAQNIHHIIVLNESYYTIIKAIREGNYQIPVIGKIDLIVNFLGKTLLKAVQPDRRKKMKTFSMWEPSENQISEDIVNKFVNHQADLQALIKNSEDLLIARAVISSPANKYIVYKLETAFDIIVTHEQRHFEQAKEVLIELKKKPSAQN